MAQSARHVAFDILKSAAKNSTYSNIALDRALDKAELSVSDRGLVTAIVMGVTERELTLDAIIDALSQNGSPSDIDARVLLRMGIYQLYYLDRIPDHAAVNETVGLAPKRTRGYVNAVLRSFLRARDKGEIDALFPSKREDALGYLSLKYSFPREICRVFCEIYGEERAERIFEIFNRPPKMTLRVNTIKISRAEYAALLDGAGISYELSDRLPDAIILQSASFESLPHAREGYFFVQDEASQICVEALDARRGELIIDTCSCPGSKSFGTAIKMQNEGEIFAFDLHESKLSLINSGAQRLGIDIINAQRRDGREPDTSLFARADRVLCDVPCSGLGVIAKKPEIRYKRVEEFSRLPDIQYAILSASANYVKIGGILVYSTCTVLPDENERNVERFLAEHLDFEPMEFEVSGRRSEQGMLSLSPDTDLCDGFFVAKMKRKE